MLELRGVTKRFGAFRALGDVDFKIGAGEIVGLLGENGAGKSTLISIVAGSIAPTSGVLQWQGQPIKPASPRETRRLGIGVVHQHFKLVANFTVAENIALSAPRGRFLFKDCEWRARISDWASGLGWQIDPAKKVEELSVGQRQRVEILKALFVHEEDHSAQLLLLDEPTANLTPGEVEELFGVLQALRKRGCAIVFVSHKLNEVLAICDRVTVLRKGKIVGERTVENTNADDLAELMVGRALPEKKEKEKRREGEEETEKCLEIKDVSSGILRDFSLAVRSGEIVGIAGVDGNGQAELIEVLSGLRKLERGAVENARSPLAVIPPDRGQVGLIPAFTLYENMALHPALRRECKSFFRFDWRKAQARTRELMQRFDVRAPQAQESTPASQLSGGNQQKLIIARALSFPHRAVIAADPTRGLDVAATQFVHAQLIQAAREGAGVLLISTDLDEVLKLSHRVGVLYEGRLLPDENLLPRGASREAVGALMGGFSQTRRQGEVETRRNGA